MIRQFRPEDASSCCRLIRVCLDGDPSYPPAVRQKILTGETALSMDERARLFYVAVHELENGIAGVAGLDMNEIRMLYVAPEHRRRGIGRAFVEHFKSMVPSVLFADIFVYSSIHAAAFYKACGFIEKGPFCFDLGGELLPTIFMTFPVRQR